MNCLLHLLIIKRMATGKDNAAKKYPHFVWQFMKKA